MNFDWIESNIRNMKPTNQTRPFKCWLFFKGKNGGSLRVTQSLSDLNIGLKEHMTRIHLDKCERENKNANYGDLGCQGVYQTVGIVCNLAKIESFR